MPEILEIEYYRQAAEAVVGRRVRETSAPDAWFCKGVTPEEVIDAVTGRTVRQARRRGKLLVLDLSGGVRLGLRFGMTGRLVVDGRHAMGELEYGSNRDLAEWDRFGLRFGRGSLRLNDPRRLGGVTLDPDEDALGPDAFTITAKEFAAAVADSRAPIKARLLDQSAIAGVGNLLADETLWRAGVDPLRPAESLDPSSVRTLHRTLCKTLADLFARGGSHLGDLGPHRHRDGHCPRDGEPLRTASIGGRTTWWCPRHQQ
jgi:formamidopyrimidine-DNA glycosylase